MDALDNTGRTCVLPATVTLMADLCGRNGQRSYFQNFARAWHDRPTVILSKLCTRRSSGETLRPCC